MAKIFYSVFISVILFHQVITPQIVNKVLISGLGGQHEIDVQSAFYLGYASYNSTQFQGEVLIYPNSLQNSFIYAEQNGFDMIIRSTTGLITGIQLANNFPTIKLVMPSGSNSFVQTYSGDVMSSPVIITGAGVDSNVTGYKVEFYSEDPITGDNLSSFSNGYIAGQIAFIANTLACSIDSAKFLARDTGSQGGEFDPYSGFGKIIIDNILGEPFPVELSFFNANVTDNIVILKWRTETEIDNYGFKVLRQFSIVEQDDEWVTVGFVYGNGNSNSPIEYEFIDEVVGKVGKYSYRLKQLDNDGSFEYSTIVAAVIDAPNTFHLSQNYPNPFNPETKIDFTLPHRETTSLKVYNILGELEYILINGEIEAGTHSLVFNASKLPSGIYIYRLETESFSSAQRMTLIK